MQKVELTMTNEEGLHSRPAMEFSKAAANFKSKVEIEKDGMSFDSFGLHLSRGSFRFVC